ncbi:DUF2752 domain-containing protein [Flavobacterium sp.]|uniref:DUF2752 domain-containing protein n=1 Tax=Flavobacterium sp. TaxID=239 RepID=UPI002B4B3763|nr:DUF2752 domain-containing protein [Flavobacterium sp.]
MIPCMNKKIFGVDCLGCGTQRSFMLLLNGEFSAAFHMFPAIYTTLFLFGFLGLHFIDKSRSYHKIIIGLAITNAVIMIISYIYKITNY